MVFATFLKEVDLCVGLRDMVDLDGSFCGITLELFVLIGVTKFILELGLGFVISIVLLNSFSFFKVGLGLRVLFAVAVLYGDSYVDFFFAIFCL